MTFPSLFQAGSDWFTFNAIASKSSLALTLILQFQEQRHRGSWKAAAFLVMSSCGAEQPTMGTRAVWLGNRANGFRYFFILQIPELLVIHIPHATSQSESSLALSF